MNYVFFAELLNINSSIIGGEIKLRISLSDRGEEIGNFVKRLRKQMTNFVSGKWKNILDFDNRSLEKI